MLEVFDLKTEIVLNKAASISDERKPVKSSHKIETVFTDRQDLKDGFLI